MVCNVHPRLLRQFRQAESLCEQHDLMRRRFPRWYGEALADIRASVEMSGYPGLHLMSGSTGLM